MHWRIQKFCLEGAQDGKILCRYFDDVFRWRNHDDVTENDVIAVFKFDFVIIGSKKTQFGQISQLYVTKIEC